MRSGGGASSGNVAQLVDVESVVAGRQSFDCDCYVSGFTARRLVERNVAPDPSLGNREHRNGFSRFHGLELIIFRSVVGQRHIFYVIGRNALVISTHSTVRSSNKSAQDHGHC